MTVAKSAKTCSRENPLGPTSHPPSLSLLSNFFAVIPAISLRFSNNGYTMADSDDYYELLGLTAEDTNPTSLARAWRLYALKNHPDKVGVAGAERFILGKQAHAVLSDVSARAAYDAVRSARRAKARQNELFEGKRRQMKDDLEAREKGFKRARTEDDNEERLERELRRLAEDGKRRRKEREEALKEDVNTETAGRQGDELPTVQEDVSEINRTIKVRYRPTESFGQDQVLPRLSSFGKIETLQILNASTSKNKKKRACMVVYESIVGAFSAVEDFKEQQWPGFESVTWALNKEPDIISSYASGFSEAGSTPSTPARSRSTTSGIDFLNMNSKPSTPAAAANGEGLKKMPSFSSFASTPRGSPFGKSLGVNSPSLEEMTMIRLKNAEKKRLADEIQRQDDEAAAAAAAKDIRTQL